MSAAFKSVLSFLLFFPGLFFFMSFATSDMWFYKDSYLSRICCYYSKVTKGQKRYFSLKVSDLTVKGGSKVGLKIRLSHSEPDYWRMID